MLCNKLKSYVLHNVNMWASYFFFIETNLKYHYTKVNYHGLSKRRNGFGNRHDPATVIRIYIIEIKSIPPKNVYFSIKLKKGLEDFSDDFKQ